MFFPTYLNDGESLIQLEMMVKIMVVGEQRSASPKCLNIVEREECGFCTEK